MRKIVRFFLCSAIAVFLFFHADASHIVGGEMSYTCLGNDVYEITLKVYRDCFNSATPFDNPTNVYVFDQNGQIVQTLPITFPGSDTLPNNANNPCLSVPPGICVEQAIFIYDVTLPPIAGGYTLVYQRCCRNASINNVFDPANTGATYLGTIPDAAFAECNSSPQFNNFPPTVVCVNEGLVFDHSATDVDGDSLVYMLCAPYLGADASNPYPAPPGPPPYNFVTFVSPYSFSDPMGGSPPMAIDPATGILTVTPTSLGQYVVGVCVSEYRNGVLLSEHKRDFQFNVTTCQPSVIASTPGVINQCSSNTITFVNNSIGGTFYHWDFGTGNAADTSNEFSPTFTFPDTGIYTVTLYVNPGTTCGDTITATVYIYPTLTGAILAPDGCVGQPDLFTDQTTSTYGTLDSWSWSFGDGDTSDQQNPSHIFDTPGDYDIQLVVGNSVGCSDTITQTITIFDSPTVLATPHDTVICYLDVVQLNASASGASNYSWQPNYNLSDPNSSNPVAGPDITVTYTVTVSNSFGCVAQDTVHITVYDTIIAAAGIDTTICPGSSVQLNGSGGINYSWSPATGLNNPNISNPIATPAQTTTYVLNTSVGSCSGTASVTVFVKPFPVIVAGPDESICQGDSVMISASGGTSYTWTPGSTLSNTAISNPLAFPLVTTTYIVSATDSNACPFVGQDSLKVSVIPVPPIFISEDTTIILGTSASLSVSGGATYQWVPPTGLDDPTSATPTATPTETTTYYVYITTADGCPALDSVTIIVNPEPIVVFPSAFSPNSDGKNDFFRPVILGLAHLDEFRIFNRWGEEMFADNNINVSGGPLPENLSWDGSFKGEVQPLGVYIYYLKGVASATGTTITRQGNFTLVR